MEPKGKDLQRQILERELEETLKLVESCIDHLDDLEAGMGMESPKSGRLRSAYMMARKEIERKLRI